ncbi:MAG: metallophosphoesterase [Microcystis sp. M048S1]|uniref:metallophosphoesterase family protein n=1 Tax=unclassified Microcystis TaxID=2643300 RepID=UPI0011924C6C|nr:MULTISPECIES: metallophosphoesterase family protein [unclassified Microcystis]MCA2901637.1 metallophosphoesterase [Microcystis sp. M035S1]MCA2724188.1 metallophosphoesterase [Microcystis sp. M176S2]MCA2727691.1 metallophosphoesterase [Microcystis sp. M166S2]MCA2731141.1 metallophosphoesterase [Microcystis sp. M162S2]MCA2748226.1 metallophosphoesterase [Microcystis sp. M155S2]
MWAILSGIQGNLPAYQAVLEDIQQRSVTVENLYILGDFIGVNPDSEMLVEQIRYPTKNNLYPQVCRGWWEEQCLILHSLGATGEPTELIHKHGIDSTKQLWDAVSLETVQWLRNLDFGFVELDCLLIHGSSVSVSEELTPDTPPWQILDRLQRVGVNNLFCGRAGKVFDYSLQSANLTSTVTTLDKRQPSQTLTIQDKRLIGVGSVGKELNKAVYTLYNPSNNCVEFITVPY